MLSNLQRCLHISVIRYVSRLNLSGSSSLGVVNSAYLKQLSANKIHTSSMLLCLADGAGGSHKATPFQRKVLVFTKVYKSEADIPDRITRSKMKNAMDKFRVKMSIIMVAATAVFAAIMAFIGRRARDRGESITKQTLARRRGE